MHHMRKLLSERLPSGLCPESGCSNEASVDGVRPVLAVPTTHCHRSQSPSRVLCPRDRHDHSWWLRHQTAPPSGENPVLLGGLLSAWGAPPLTPAHKRAGKVTGLRCPGLARA